MAGDENQTSGLRTASMNSMLAQSLTPESAKDDDESSVTQKPTGLKSPTRGRNQRASFASPTQASNARRGIMSPSHSTAMSPVTSPIISSFTSPATSSRPSNIPRSHRKSHSVDTTSRIIRSPSPLDDTIGTIASLSGRLKTPERQSTKKSKAKASQHRRARSHEHNNRLDTHDELDEREINFESWAGPSLRKDPVGRYGSHEVQQNIMSDAIEDVKGKKEATRPEKLEALSRLVVPEGETSFGSPGSASTLVTTTERKPENHTGTQTSPGLNPNAEKDRMLQQEIQDLHDGFIIDLENDNETLLYDLQMKQKDIETRDQALRELTVMIEALKENLRIRSEELVVITKNVQMSNETLSKLRNDFEKLTNAAQHVLRSNIYTKLDPNILRNLSGETNFSPEAKALYSNFVQIVQKLESKLRTLSTTSQQHHEESTASKEKLELVEQELTAMQEREGVAVSESQKAKEELAIWKQRCEDERKLKEKAQHNYRAFRKIAEEMYQPDLEKNNKKLHSELMVLQHENSQLQEHLEARKACVSDWEDEHRTMKERAETKQSEMEDELDRQKAEMLVYIREYHDKVIANSHWDIEGLQQRIKEMNREQEATIKLTKSIEREKSMLEETTIPKFWQRISALEKENTKLKDEWAMKHHVTSIGTVTQVPAGCPIPRLLHPEETARREAKLEKLRQRQLKLRENRARIDAYAEAMLEKARERVIGKKLYAKGEWRSFAGKSSWQIWDGDSWMCVASKRDFNVAEKLRVRGIIPRAMEEGDEMKEEETRFPRLMELSEAGAGEGEIEGVSNLVL